MKVLSCEHVGGNIYDVTTESEEYGRVTQKVLMFPPSMFDKPQTPENVRQVAVYAWVGEDELGSGEVGLKQALTRAGCVPLAAVKEGNLRRETLREQLQDQADRYKKTIRLCKFVFLEEIETIAPRS